jgi:pilus assembly protein CpaF
MNGFELILPFLRPIQHLILDPDISEIMVNGPERIFIEKAGHLQAVPEVKLTHESLIVAVKNIARRLGDDISDSKPILDSRLPDGSRVAAVIPPCSIHGVALTIRKFSSYRFKMENLVEVGTVTAKLSEQIQEFVLQRKNILICGGTSSGKTTLANALTDFIPNDERIVLIEDTAEIQIQKDNVVRFEARLQQSGLPAVTIRDLLKATLRHRPDRIILGEIRGGEAFDLLQLLNTGHSGTISTVHANSAAQGISRFTTCVLQSGIEMPYAAIKANIAESLNIVVQIERRPGYRFVSEVLEIQSYKPEQDRYELRNLYRLSDELTERRGRNTESSSKFLAES